jgi:putative lipoprotein
MKLILALLLSILCFGCANQKARNNDWYGIDKAAHFGISAAVAASVTNYAESRGKQPCHAAGIGLSVSLAVGASKEWYDKQIKKTFWSWEDLTYDLLGGSIGALAASNC